MGLSLSSRMSSRSDEFTTCIRSTIVDLMKPECLKVKQNKKKRQPHLPNREISEVRSFTLEELLEDSPVRSSDCSIGSKRVHPSAGRNPTALISGARDNFSMEESLDLNSESGRFRTGLSSKANDSFILNKKVRADEEDEEVMEVSAIRRSESRGSKRVVRFTLPKKDDILFYTPEREVNCRSESRGSKRVVRFTLPKKDDILFYTPEREVNCKGSLAQRLPIHELLAINSVA